MKTIKDVVRLLENWVPKALQENYDNCGLLVGNASAPCSGVLVCLDVTEAVLDDAMAKNCNMVVAHHPIIFSGLKKIADGNYVERIVAKAIKNDLAIYALHTNLDNMLHGVSSEMAAKLNLVNTRVLAPKKGLLKKLHTYIAKDAFEKFRDGMFLEGIGHVGNYSECSFSVVGEGTFKGNELTNPTIGQKGKRSVEVEVKIELLFPAWKEAEVLAALRKHHIYEEIAYEVVPLDNVHQEVGSGIIGELAKPMTEKAFMQMVKSAFKCKVLRHTANLGKKIQKVAVCGGSGSFLTKQAIAAGADAYISADYKYHEFFDADGQILVVDIGHYESEQFTIDLIFRYLRQKITTFAIQKTKVNTNSVHYFV